MPTAGDRLNFGLAAEQAKAEGFKAEVVIMGDDCALPQQGASKRRGIAGCMLVFKVWSSNVRAMSWLCCSVSGKMAPALSPVLKG